jgi:predicted MFS family arabinose efflux permease
MPAHFRVFIFFTLAYFLSYFFRSANAIIAPDLARELGLGAAELGFMTSLFFATFALVQIPLGLGLDRWGPRWVTPGLMLVGGAGSLIFSLAPNFALLSLGRALIGIGMAGVLMGSLKAFSQWYPAERFATISGLLVGFGSSGALIAATPLAWLNQAIGWRAVFMIGAGLVLAVSLSIMLWTRNSPPGVDWPGGQQSLAGLRAIFSDLRFWRITPLTLFLAGTMMAFHGLWAGPYLFDVLGLTELEAGNILLLMGLGATVGFTVSGWLCDRFGLVRVIIISTALFLLSQLALLLQPSPALIGPVYALFGFGGSFNIMLLAHTRRIFPPNVTGLVISAANVFGIGGTFLVQWWMGLIIGAFPANAGHYPPQAHLAALSFTAVGGLLALLWYLPLARSSAQARQKLASSPTK